MSSSISTERAAIASSTPGPALVFAMALSCGLAVANIYYNQPMLAVMAQDFPGQSAIPLITMLTQSAMRPACCSWYRSGMSSSVAGSFWGSSY